MSTDRQDDPLFSDYPRLTPGELLRRLEPRVKRRSLLLEEIFIEHIRDWSGVYINRRILMAAVESYYCDVYRLKFFRPVKWIDDHKKAAYTMKWLARMRPVQFHSGARLTQSTLMSNAWFSVISGLNLIGVDDGWKDDSWWTAYIGNLAYLLHYHSPSAEQLSSEMCVLQTLGGRRDANGA